MDYQAQSWGRLQRVAHTALRLTSRLQNIAPFVASQPHVLPFGNGRSYGDSCMNPGGALLLTRGMDHFIQFDPALGILECEAGVLLDEIIRLVLPQGWFLPVTPGTRFVTVGGAIANDVHGKNHHRLGTFGCHVLEFGLQRSDGARLRCSASQNPALFGASIGGLGLTGLITDARLQLRRVANPWLDVETIPYADLREFYDLCLASDAEYEYTVAWVDCAGAKSGRGIFMRANHAPALAATPPPRAARQRRLPGTPPFSLINPLTLKLLNSAYYHRARAGRSWQHCAPFFYPLDAVLEWNRAYGPRGFYQYQCVLPHRAGLAASQALLDAIGASGLGSFLAVLKLCGEPKSPGLLSFPLPGISLALDFPNRGPSLHALFARLDAIVQEAGGRLYAAKDARMPATLFQAGYPDWREFARHIDPHFSSALWRRVSQTGSFA
ncbi:FAD-binding oxidoreductase [Massilia sp. W12]|uniref:FAD-binding oxidoreductase n=1 Tax=Massilia sp. W12 TaxID=3126507 RepID=UPI0030CC8D20